MMIISPKLILCFFLGLCPMVVFAQFDGYYDQEDYQGLDSLYIYFSPKVNVIQRDNATLRMLDKVSDFLLHNPAFRVRLDGHAAPNELSSGDANKLLAIKRAYQVRQYLESKGIPHCKIKIEGYGDTQPIFLDTIPQVAHVQKYTSLPTPQGMENYYKKNHIKTPRKLRKQIKQYEMQRQERSATTRHTTMSVKTNRRVECHFYLNENQNVTVNYFPSDTLEILDTLNHQMTFNYNTITPNNVDMALQIARKALHDDPQTSIIICRFDSISPQLEERMVFLIDYFTSKLTKKPIYFSIFPCDKWNIYVGLYRTKCREEKLE